MNQIIKYTPPEKNYTKVSNEIIRNSKNKRLPKLSLNEKMILICIYSLGPNEKLTHQLIANELDISVKTVSRVFQDLESKKIIESQVIKNNNLFEKIYIILDWTNCPVVDNLSSIDKKSSVDKKSSEQVDNLSSGRVDNLSSSIYKDNTIKNKTNINTNNKDIREKLYEQSKEETKTLIQKLQDIAVNNLEILESQFSQIYKTSSSFEDGVKNLETNINFINSHKSYYENFKARLNHATQNNYLLILNPNDLLLKEKFEEQQRSKFTNQVITDLRLIEQNKLRNPNISIYTNFFKSIEIIALNVDSVRIEFTSFIFKTFLYKEYKDIQIDENYQNKLTELTSKVSIENLLNIVDDFMNMKDYSMQRIFTAGAKDLYLLYKDNKKEVMTNIKHNLLNLTKKGM